MVFTGWLSIMATLGVAHPTFPRNWPRSAYSALSLVPSAAICGNTTTPCPAAPGQEAPSATVFPSAIRTISRLSPLEGPRCTAVTWSMLGATRVPNAPVENTSNRWDIASGPYHNVPPIPSLHQAICILLYENSQHTLIVRDFVPPILPGLGNSEPGMVTKTSDNMAHQLARTC